ncbi:MAG: hypothetical protein IPK30_03075 [Cellvibrionales bacterium]|nr:hypothetical protein [Cellvibrionales bacterium]
MESELLGQAGVLQAAVFGEAKPFLVAVLFAPSLADTALQQAVNAANAALPDYARCDTSCVRPNLYRKQWFGNR